MKITIPENLKGKELYKFLVQNKSALIQQKKSLPLKYADTISADVSLSRFKSGTITKAQPEDTELNEDVIRVKVVANTAGWCDSHMDVLLRDAANKSIRERKGMIPHLHDHVHTLDAEVGDVVDIYTEDIPLMQLGLNKSGIAQAVIFETDVKRAYNEKVFNKYRHGKVKQHSIGLQYVKIELAINDEDSQKEYDLWQKHIGGVINREYVEDKGYFWVVPEYKLMENSAVLFGSNILTPTLNAKQDSTEEEPPAGTQTQPRTSLFKSIGKKL